MNKNQAQVLQLAKELKSELRGNARVIASDDTVEVSFYGRRKKKKKEKLVKAVATNRHCSLQETDRSISLTFLQ